MIFGISAQSIPEHLPYASAISSACSIKFPPALAYAIAYYVSIDDELNGKWKAYNAVSGAGGHGLFQLLPPVPTMWQDPKENAIEALRRTLIPDLLFFRFRSKSSGDDLARIVSHSFLQGRAAAGSGLGFLSSGANQVVDIFQYIVDGRADKKEGPFPALPLRRVATG